MSKAKAAKAAEKDAIKSAKDKIKAAKANLKVATENYTAGVDDGKAGESLQEYEFGTGDIVKNVNTKCPHHGSQGIINKVMDLPDMVGKVAVYTVTNNGDNYKAGDKLTKTVDQLEPVQSQDNLEEATMPDWFPDLKWNRELKKAMGPSKKLMISGKEVDLDALSDADIDGVDRSEGPDDGTVEAHFISAKFVDGTELNDDELEELNDYRLAPYYAIEYFHEF